MPRALQALPLAAVLAVLACAQAAAAGAAGAQSSASSQPDSSADQPLEEVTVTAAKLEREVLKFVGRIASLENEEGLPRWNVPICPQESGLPRSEGVWVLSRFVEIARAAGVPMARGHCRPNLYIVASSDPEVVLRRTKANNRNRVSMFGDATPFVINAFIDTPRAVRVWYKSSEGAASGQPFGGENMGGVSASDRPSMTFPSGGASRLRANVVWNLSLVVELADQRRLQGLTLGQFADYLAMVGLAQIKPGAGIGDAPSILKLFEGSPKAAPAGMTDWDRAFLKSLYATDQASKRQRGEISRAMVRELTH